MRVDENHLLEYPGVRFEPIPGKGRAMNIRRFLIIHFTAGATAMSSINWWRDPKARGAGAHIIIDRDGTIYQCRAFNRTAGHAGASRWTDPNTGKTYRGLNSCSIGIELANWGDNVREGMGAGKWPLPAGWSAARHKNGGKVKHWENFPQVQINACHLVSRTLVMRYNLDDIAGHDDIAPDRKNDPGPAFPMNELRLACGFPPR